MTDESSETQAPEVLAPAEPPPQPVFKFDKGVDTAQIWMSAFLIVVAGIIAYSNVFSIPFHAEDQRLIRDNTALHSFSTFADGVNGETSRVLTMLTFAINWWIAPNSSAAFHAVNLVLHLANGVLLFLLCRALLGPGVNPVISMLAGMIFVLHPLNTESVDYIVGRSGMLATFFALCSLLLFVRATRTREGETPVEPDAGAADKGLQSLVQNTTPVLGGVIAASVFCFVFACLADASAIPLVLLTVVLDALLHGKPIRKRVSIHAPYWGALAALAIVLGAATTHSSTPAADPHQRHYVVELARMTVAPYGLHPGHVAPDASGTFLAMIVSVVLLGAILLAGRRLPALAFALAWVFLIQGVPVRGGLAPGERDMYLLLAGASIALPALFNALRPAPLRAVAGIAVAALMLAAGTATYMRNIVWQDGISLWSDAVEKAPDSAVAQRNLGKAFLTLADAMGPNTAEPLQNAETHFKRAVELSPNDVGAMAGLGEALMGQGRADEALAEFQDVLGLDIANRRAALSTALILNERANATGNHDDLARSMEYFKRADTLKPLDGDARARYALALVSQGDLETALPLLTAAVGGDANAPLAATLEGVRENLKHIKSMEQQSLALLGKDPSDATGVKMQAQLLALQGHDLQASYVLDRLMRRNVQDFTLWVLMGYVRAKMKEPETFIKEWPSPPTKPAGAASAWGELARTCAETGLWDAALAYLESPPATAEQGQPALVAMADIAAGLRQDRRAQDYLTRATEAYPANPLPWLRLCDMAIAANNADVASRCLSEAESRGADPQETAKRKERLGLATPKNPIETTTKIVQ